MTDPLTDLFDDYTTRFRRGEQPDLRAVLRRAGEDRELLAALVAAWLGRVNPPPPDQHSIASMQERLRSQVDPHDQELAVDEVLLRTLEAALVLPGVHAGVITVTALEDVPLVETIGRTPADEAAAPPLDAFAVPIAGERGPIGFLVVYGPFGAEPGGDLRSELELLGLRAGTVIENALRFRKALELAHHDALTGLYNQRYLHEALARELSRAQSYGGQLILILVDIKDFKTINAGRGHIIGDAVLSALGQRIREVVHSAAIAARIGGDEFAVVLPASTLEDANRFCSRLHDALAAHPTDAGTLTLSIGIAELTDDDDVHSLLYRADVALYRASARGGGCADESGVREPRRPTPEGSTANAIAEREREDSD